MLVELSQLVGRIDPKRTILLFGSGSSMPSGGKSGPALADALAEKFDLGGGGYSLTEVAQIITDRVGRRRLVEELRRLIANIKPAGGILNLPLYDWNGIYTTNYDRSVEVAYEKSGKDVRVVSSNFDFGLGRDDMSARLYKVHGTIQTDVVDGSVSRLIISDEDYELTSEYRQMIWDRLKADLAENDCIIIGQSLADSHLRDLVTEVARLKQSASHSTKISLLLFEADINRAALYARRGLHVAFGGIDDFFVEMAKSDQATMKIVGGQSVVDLRGLHPVTTLVAEAIDHPTTLERMYNGWPASWSDVSNGFTFARDDALQAATKIADFSYLFVTFLGASGVGKTTAARQCVLELMAAGYQGWEHNSDRELLVREWLEVAERLQENEEFGVLFIDDAHEHLHQINQLADQLVAKELTHLQLILSSARND
jgi:hypothetical protein